MANEYHKLSDQLIDFIKLNGPTTTSHLALHFGVTAMGVRQHLLLHLQNGLIGFTEKAADRGRPKRWWHLTEKAQKRYSDGHVDLFHDMLRRFECADVVVYRSVVVEALQSRFQSLRQRLAKQMLRESCCSLVMGLVKAALAELGYLCEYVYIADQGAVRWYEYHCPILTICQRTTLVADVERQKMTEILAGIGEVTTQTHILDGAHRTEQWITLRQS